MIYSCGTAQDSEEATNEKKETNETAESQPHEEKDSIYFYGDVYYEIQKIENFSDSILHQRIKNKIEQDKPIIIHSFVPLCDNENQGIMPVSSSLGNGKNLKTNLYWGAKYGLKNYFVNILKWEVDTSIQSLDATILERLVVTKTFPNGAKVVLVADAYSGDKMAECLQHYMLSISGNRKKEIKLGERVLKAYSNADLITFTGHNGLMDNTIDYVLNTDSKVRRSCVLGCISYEYFTDYMRLAKCYPMITTTNLMAPEAYLLKPIIEGLVYSKTNEQIRLDVGKAYNTYQKCGIRGATKLFKTGW